MKRIKRWWTFPMAMVLGVVSPLQAAAEKENVGHSGASIMLALQDEILIKGTVTDADGAPLTGVSVKLKGTAHAVTSDLDGNYSISLPTNTGSLQFTYVGYVLKEETIGGRQTINVQLVQDSQSLTDVVVVGYGTQTKGSITGAVSSIDSEDIVRTPAVAATSALVGKVPGITARATDSRPGNGTSLQIRNLGAPLYVIDGVPYSTNDGTTSFGLNTGLSGQNVFNIPWIRRY